MSVGVLVDITKCMGCRSCQVACKAWNDNPGEDTSCSGCYENPPGLSDKTWTKVKFTEIEENGRLQWLMHKTQCMHCEYPACAMVCPEQVHQKTDLGAVIHEGEKCIGCQNCLTVCPFNIPNIKWADDPASLWGNTLPEITRCNFCFDRINNGEEPACVKACSTGALAFGDRDELIIKAMARILKWPGKYVDHIYGESEVGGTAWLYLSPVPFEQLGFPVLSDEPLDVSQFKESNLYPAIVPEKDLVSPVNTGITGAVIGLAAGAVGVVFGSLLAYFHSPLLGDADQRSASKDRRQG